MIQVKSLRVTAFDRKDNLIGCGRQYDWKRNGTDGETEHRIVDYTECDTGKSQRVPLGFCFWMEGCVLRNILQKKDITQLLEQSRNRQTAKTMGGFDLTLLGIGAVIGTGVMVLTGITAAKNAGPSVIFSFIIAAVVCSLAALCYAEIASVLPVYGSAYIYSYTTMGEIVGHLMGWTLLSVYMVTASAVASGWSSYFNNLLAEIGMPLPDSLLHVPSQGASSTFLPSSLLY
ncbi:Hypothetical protein ACI5QL_03874 [Bacillus velezensis]